MTIKEMQRKAATLIQSCFRGFKTRKVVKYCLVGDVELASKVRNTLDAHFLKPEPYNYPLRPTFKKVRYRKIVQKLDIVVNGIHGEYYG